MYRRCGRYLEQLLDDDCRQLLFLCRKRCEVSPTAATYETPTVSSWDPVIKKDGPKLKKGKKLYNIILVYDVIQG